MSATSANANDRMHSVLASRDWNIFLSSAAGVAQRLFQIAVYLVMTPALINGLGKASFGVWAAAVTLIWMATIFDLGIGRVVALEFLDALSFNRREQARRILATALWLGALIAVLELSAVMWLSTRLGPSESADAYLIAAACMAINVPLSLASALWTAARKLYVVWIWEAVQTAVTAISMWTLLSWTTDVRWYVLASAGGILIVSFLSLSQFLVNHPDLWPAPARPSLKDIWRLLCRGVPYLILVAGAFLASQSDPLIALSLLGDEASAKIAIGQRLGVISLALLQALMLPLWPAFAHAAALGDSVWLEKRVWPAAFTVVSTALFGSALILLFAGQMIEVWLGGKITLGPDILSGIVISVLLPAAGLIPDLLLNALGVIWFQVRIAILFGILAFVLKIALAQIWGVAGILAATGLAYGLTHLPAYLWWAVRWLRRPKELRIQHKGVESRSMAPATPVAKTNGGEIPAV